MDVVRHLTKIVVELMIATLQSPNDGLRDGVCVEIDVRDWSGFVRKAVINE